MGDSVGRMVAVDDGHLAKRPVLAMEDVFSPGIANDEAFATSIVAPYYALRSHGALDTLRASAR